MRTDPNLHYLDNAATTMVDPAVADAIAAALRESWANPSSLYDPAVLAEHKLNAARAKIAKTLNCAAREIYFTACGSESNNLAILGAALPRQAWGNKIVTTGFEHPSVQLPIRALRDRGFDVAEVAPGADGRLDVQKLIDAVDKNTVLVACMAVNNETGAVQDIARLAAGVKAKNSRTAVHIDAVQAWLRIPLDLKKLPGVDTLAVSGHKVHAPKGIGALYLCENQRQHLRPPYLGGHQERGIRPGTENLPYAVGLGLAAEQGARRMRAAAANYGWNLNYGGIALMWRGGCIIRSVFLGKIKEAFERDADLVNLMLDPFFADQLAAAQGAWRKVCALAIESGVPAPAFTAALSYYDGYRCARLSANLLQAQRDYFGAHTYERLDQPRGQFFHTNWTGEGGNTAASTYTV